MVIGNVGTDPEMRYTPNGNPVTSFRFAVGHHYTTSDGEKKEETEWFTIVAWNKLAESCNQYLEKGKRAFVDGRLKSQTWTGQDGQTRLLRNAMYSEGGKCLGSAHIPPVKHEELVHYPVPLVLSWSMSQG